MDLFFHNYLCSKTHTVLFIIQVDGVDMPTRLRETVVSAKLAKTKHDVLVALKFLLKDRQDEALYLGR